VILKGSEIIAEHLIENGVPYVFGLCGHGILGFMDAFHDRKDRIQLVSVRHESAAGYMADAYFRVTHKPVATYTSCGPGSVNLLIAMAGALMDSSAFLSITGNVPTSQFNRGPFQETGKFFQADWPTVARSYVKRVLQPTRPEMMAHTVRQAMVTMMAGRPGPVNIDVPFNVFAETAEVKPSDLKRQVTRLDTASPASDQALEQTLAELLAAERPVIAVGGGLTLSEGWSELRELVDLLQVPFHYTPQGKVGIDERHPLALGATGRNGTFAANQAGKNADVIFAVGHSFDDRATSGWLPGYTYNFPQTRLIQLDVDAAEIGRNYPVALGLIGDAKASLARLVAIARHKLGGNCPDRSQWLARIGEWKAKWAAFQAPLALSDSAPIRPERLMAELRKALPDNTILLSDVGVHHNWVVQLWENRNPNHLLQAWGFAAMGFGVAGGLGAKLAAPDQPVVVLCGDGGFTMHSHVLATAVEYNIPVVWVIFNNYAYGSIRDQQKGFFGPRELAVDFRRVVGGELYNPDFAAMAHAYGAGGVRVDRPQELAGALEVALKSGRPYVVDVHIDREIRPAGTGSWILPPQPSPEPNFYEE